MPMSVMRSSRRLVCAINSSGESALCGSGELGGAEGARVRSLRNDIGICVVIFENFGAEGSILSLACKSGLGVGRRMNNGDQELDVCE